MLEVLLLVLYYLQYSIARTWVQEKTLAVLFVAVLALSAYFFISRTYRSRGITFDAICCLSGFTGAIC